jgi:LemA protein
MREPTNRRTLWLGALVAVAFLSGGAAYVRERNELVRKDEHVKRAWSQLNVQLERRADLIPNLVATVKGYAQHDAEVFENVAAARAALLRAATPADRIMANAALDGVLGRLVAVSESYPQLKASEHFLELQAQLEGTENRIAIARLRYNASLQEYNAYLRRFPAGLVARSSGFRRDTAYFDIATGAVPAPPATSAVPAGHGAPPAH